MKGIKGRAALIALVAALLAIAALAGCQAAPTPTPASETTAPRDLLVTPTPRASTGSGRQLPATRDDVPRTSLQEFRGLFDSPRNILIVDTRDAREYAAGHIPGAVNVPYAQVEARYQELSPTAKIVTYCA